MAEIRIILSNEHKQLSTLTYAKYFRRGNGTAATNNHTSNTNAGYPVATKQFKTINPVVLENGCAKATSQHLGVVTKLFA